MLSLRQKTFFCSVKKRVRKIGKGWSGRKMSLWRHFITWEAFGSVDQLRGWVIYEGWCESDNFATEK